MFRVTEAFSPSSKKDILLTKGEYAVVDCKNRSFDIAVPTKEKEEIVTISMEESHPFGKIVIKLGR